MAILERLARAKRERGQDGNQDGQRGGFRAGRNSVGNRVAKAAEKVESVHRVFLALGVIELHSILGYDFTRGRLASRYSGKVTRTADRVAD